jgi:hypothetical protein
MNHAPPVQKPPDLAKSGPLRPLAGPLVARHPGASPPMLRLWSLPWAGEPPLELDTGTLEGLRFGSGEGSLLLYGRWQVNGRQGRVRLLWSEETLLIQDAEMDDPPGVLAGRQP